jgi:hypothetical protein
MHVKYDALLQLMIRDRNSITCRYRIASTIRKKSMLNIYCTTQFCVEILQVNKYNEIVILLHDTMHYKDSIVQ